MNIAVDRWQNSRTYAFLRQWHAERHLYRRTPALTLDLDTFILIRIPLGPLDFASVIRVQVVTLFFLFNPISTRFRIIYLHLTCRKWRSICDSDEIIQTGPAS